MRNWTISACVASLRGGEGEEEKEESKEIKEEEESFSFYLRRRPTGYRELQVVVGVFVVVVAGKTFSLGFSLGWELGPSRN